MASRFLLDRRFGAATTTVSGRARDVSGSTWREGEPGTPVTVVSLAGRRAGLEGVKESLAAMIRVGALVAGLTRSLTGLLP
jgi:hypothetical protein